MLLSLLLGASLVGIGKYIIKHVRAQMHCQQPTASTQHICCCCCCCCWILWRSFREQRQLRSTCSRVRTRVCVCVGVCDCAIDMLAVCVGQDKCIQMCVFASQQQQQQQQPYQHSPTPSSGTSSSLIFKFP